MAAYSTVDEFKNDIHLTDLTGNLPRSVSDAADTEKDAFWTRLLDAYAYEIDQAFAAAGVAVPLDPVTLIADATLSGRFTAALRRWNQILAAFEAIGNGKPESTFEQEAGRIRKMLSGIADGDLTAIPGLGSSEVSFAGIEIDNGPGFQIACANDAIGARL